MEDGGTDVEFLVPPLNLNSEDGSKRDAEKKEEGVVSTEKVEKVKEEDLGKDEAKDSVGGGLINNLISTLVTPLSPSIGKVTEHESAADGDGGDRGKKAGGVDDGGEGGLISKMVSNFFHQSEGEGGVETEEDKEEEEVMAGEKIKRLKTENGMGILFSFCI
ncbi:hypothetical protein E2542_SST08642 [Spatholobus suberectus]|nr:hypothetical protein E2542_SST08642 [Spatholobus suberectus]